MILRAISSGCVTWQGNREVTVKRIDKGTWALGSNVVGPAVVDYEVYAWDLSVRRHLGIRITLISVRLRILAVGARNTYPATVDIDPPAASASNGESLREDNAQRYGFGRYKATLRRELIDHPVEIADFARGWRHEVPGRICLRRPQKICECARSACRRACT